MKNLKFRFILLVFILIFSCKAVSGEISDDKGTPIINKDQFKEVAELQAKLHSIGNNQSSSIVAIITEKAVSQSYIDPFDFLFKDPFDDNDNKQAPKKKQFKQGGLGSGVVYKKKGNTYYIVTNNHVIDGVDSIKITVDQKKVYDAKIIAGDPDVDVAVVEIKTNDDLKVALFGDSEKIKVGDFVIAIGNPYGLQGTMTFGIISALGRGDISSSSGKINLTNFIQTDAAINPGNSGGPLINLDGEAIGINTLIYSQYGGGNVGIGFAIPINLVKKIAEQIINTGKVEHGWLGISFEELNEEKIKTLNLGNIKGGMYILNVFDNGPAEKAGLKTGDVILELNGKELLKSSDLTIGIGNSAPGVKVKLKIIRDGAVLEKEVALGNRNEMKDAVASSDSKIIDILGVELVNLNKALREKYKVPAEVNGALVVKINANGAGARAGLEEGDVIYKINSKMIESIDDVQKLLKEKEADNYYFISRKGKERIIKM